MTRRAPLEDGPRPWRPRNGDELAGEVVGVLPAEGEGQPGAYLVLDGVGTTWSVRSDGAIGHTLRALDVGVGASVRFARQPRYVVEVLPS